jgi:P4 family phage/plasmid primase-like protien
MLSDDADDDADYTDREITRMEKRIEKLEKLMETCKSAPFKNNIMIECVEVFRNSKFEDLLDKDPYLVAFQNGVYDFANDVFRNGKPEDYISQAMPIDYIDYGTVDHPSVIEIDEFFRKVLPDQEVREYFLDQVCQVFVGGNKDKQILFWTGHGDNGKSVTQQLFEKTLGNLAIKFTTTILTGKKTQAGNAAPDLARAGRGVRWAVLDEPNADEIISSGIMKQLTGNDSYFARDLFEKGRSAKEIVPLFKLHMICNSLPIIRGADKATWNRVRVIPFEATFVSQSECPESYEEQEARKIYPKDDKFTDRIASLRQPLAWYLIQRWRTVNKTERTVPEKVLVATNEYRCENDVYQQFVDETIVNRDGGTLTFTNVFNRFNEWVKESCPDFKGYRKNNVKGKLVEILGKLTKDKWHDLAFENNM